MRNCLAVEQPNGDFAQTMARQFLFSAWQKRHFDLLATSSDDRIAAVAAKAVKEVAYHEELAAEWVIRLGDGTAESRRRMIDGLEWMWRFIPEFFESDDVVQDAVSRQLAPDPALVRDPYYARVRTILSEASLEAPKDQRPILGGRRGHHSEHLGHLLAVMQYLPRTYRMRCGDVSRIAVSTSSTAARDERRRGKHDPLISSQHRAKPRCAVERPLPVGGSRVSPRSRNPRPFDRRPRHRAGGDEERVVLTPTYTGCPQPK
jgi:phenylacetate-CoA oxygenase PaaI subunit